jgi:hypothetical protein
VVHDNCESQRSPKAGPRAHRRGLTLLQRVRLHLRWPHSILASLQARTENPQLVHLVYERGAFQAELCGRSLGPTNHPTHSLECL